ncbi:hypothetical protein [Rhizobium sp. CECT 9324]|uniref:hypothetical protein n=1 Tax=Rhizobium sp. CECT 9324 TaxID=2845820 RepID=UPI001E594503|nr:hypothetical protein [Rhizobium sp. CECT 9324]CAH0341506.1 hypothetical protein RHI9324_03202 [Rhizobium sp. CECT 9324]
MVDPVNRISRSEASMPSQIDHTLNVRSDANNAWIAARQSQINDDLLELQKIAIAELARRKEQEATVDPDEQHPHSRQWFEPVDPSEETEQSEQPPKLSGESDRIGTQNFDDDTPFGERVAIL